MKDLRGELIRLGFDRVAVLDGREAGIAEKRLMLCFMYYSGNAADVGEIREGVIHPYYPVSQQAYRTARSFAEACREEGIPVRLANHIHIKKILDRLPFLQKGRNTLSYLPESGSRFHVQILTCDAETEVTDHPEEEAHGIFCGECRKCMENCPGGAIREDGFSKEACLRYWMMSGNCPPDGIARKMGNRLIGCDACENCCPHNPSGDGETVTYPIREMLTGAAADDLKEQIGSNYARRGRIRIQGCVMAASLQREDLMPEILQLRGDDNEEVRKAAEQAIRLIREKRTKAGTADGEP